MKQLLDSCKQDELSIQLNNLRRLEYEIKLNDILLIIYVIIVTTMSFAFLAIHFRDHVILLLAFFITIINVAISIFLGIGKNTKKKKLDLLRVEIAKLAKEQQIEGF